MGRNRPIFAQFGNTYAKSPCPCARYVRKSCLAIIVEHLFSNSAARAGRHVRQGTIWRRVVGHLFTPSAARPERIFSVFLWIGQGYVGRIANSDADFPVQPPRRWRLSDNKPHCHHLASGMLRTSSNVTLKLAIGCAAKLALTIRKWVRHRANVCQSEPRVPRCAPELSAKHCSCSPATICWGWPHLVSPRTIIAVFLCCGFHTGKAIAEQVSLWRATWLVYHEFCANAISPRFACRRLSAWI